MKNKINAILISIPCAALLIFTLVLTIRFCIAKEVTVAISGYDPRDLLSGHYISYQIDWNKTDCSQFENNECPIEYFAKHKEHAQWGGRYRFYIPQENAELLDRLFRSRNKNFQVVFSYSKRSAPLGKRLLIDGIEWRKALQK